jgi:hypothetical protein
MSKRALVRSVPHRKGVYTTLHGDPHAEFDLGDNSVPDFSLIGKLGA